MAFADNVFINCPLDADYQVLLRPILFTIIYLRFTPRIALERMDSGESRIAKIIELIGESKYAIHDLSRIQATKPAEIFRLNMPFELGLDVGCRRFGNGVHNVKQCLVLETQPYRYQAALSDLSGSDISAHNNNPQEAVAVVRAWLVSLCRPNAVGTRKIWKSFGNFMAENRTLLKARGFSNREIQDLAIPELIQCMMQWTARNVHDA
jgi:hypothetical protein